MSKFAHLPAFDWRKMSPLGWIVAVNVAVFTAQQVADVWFRGHGVFERFFGLSWEALAHAMVWTPLTYAFLHEGIWHIALNMLVLIFSWRAVAPQIGQRRCLWIYLLCAVGGGALWMLVSGSAFPKQELAGASAGVFGIFATFCFVYWDRPITFLLFFVFPVVMRPKWILGIFAGMEVFSLLFSELPQRFGHAGRSVPIAFSAHVGGILTAWVCYRIFRAGGFSEKKPLIELPAWLRRKKGRAAAPVSYKVNFSKPLEVSRQEVDRVLDKIAREGFAALTPQERDLLERARGVFQKR